MSQENVDLVRGLQPPPDADLTELQADLATARLRRDDPWFSRELSTYLPAEPDTSRRWDLDGVLADRKIGDQVIAATIRLGLPGKRCGPVSGDHPHLRDDGAGCVPDYSKQRSRSGLAEPRSEAQAENR